MIKVFHMIVPTFLAKDTVGLDELYHVANVKTNNLEEAFQRTNTIYHNWWEDEVEFLGSPQHGMEGCRSTSVGDVLQTEDGTYYTVAFVGFRPIKIS
jgi:hypothetical protein